MSQADALQPRCWIIVSSGCFAAVLQFKWILGRRGLFASGCFIVVVVPAPLADALPPRRLSGFPRVDALPPMLLEACLVVFAVALHCWLPICCCLHVLGSVGWDFEVEGPSPLVFSYSCGFRMRRHSGLLVTRRQPANVALNLTYLNEIHA
jgi:hypothetical protein